MIQEKTLNSYDSLMARYEKEVKRRCDTSKSFRDHVIDLCVRLSDNPIGAIAKGRSNDVILYWQCEVMGKPPTNVCKRLKMHKMNIDIHVANGRRIVCTQLIRTDPDWRKEYEQILEQEDWEETF